MRSFVRDDDLDARIKVVLEDPVRARQLFRKIQKVANCLEDFASHELDDKFGDSFRRNIEEMSRLAYEEGHQG